MKILKNNSRKNRLIGKLQNIIRANNRYRTEHKHIIEGFNDVLKILNKYTFKPNYYNELCESFDLDVTLPTTKETIKSFNFNFDKKLSLISQTYNNIVAHICDTMEIDEDDIQHRDVTIWCNKVMYVMSKNVELRENNTELQKQNDELQKELNDMLDYKAKYYSLCRNLK